VVLKLYKELEFTISGGKEFHSLIHVDLGKKYNLKTSLLVLGILYSNA